MVFFADRDLPASAERVLEILGRGGPMTHMEIVAAARLPSRTVRFALARLRASGRVVWRWSLRDARQRLYAVPRREDVPQERSGPRDVAENAMIYNPARP